MIHKMTKVRGADFCDDEVFVFSTVGQGPKGEKGEKGDSSTYEQTYNAVGQFIGEHPEYVTTIEDGAVTHSKMANDSVGQDNIIALSVGTDEIANGAVTTPKIADGAVTSQKISDGAVTPTKLSSNAIPTMSASTKGIAKVGAGLAMNGEAIELDGDGDIATAVESWLDAHPEATTTVVDGAITTPKIADGAVTDGKLAQSGGVLDSVSNVNDGVNRLNAMSFNANGNDNSMPVNWFERGGITNGESDGWRPKSRAHTTDIISFDTASTITVTNGQYGLAYFNSDDEYTSWSSWKTSADIIYIPAGRKFRLLVTPNNTAGASEYYDLDVIVGAVVLKVDAMQKRTINISDIAFEHGGLDANGIDDDAYRPHTRARSIGFSKFPYDVSVHMSTGSYIVSLYNEDHTYSGHTAWRTSDEYVIKAGQNFRLLITPNPSSNDVADLQTMVDSLVVNPLQSSPISASPNIIFACRNVDASAFPPESKWAVQAAAENQYDRVRFTVRKTTDGYYINCHDSYINNVARNMDGTEIEEQVPAFNQTLDTLNQYDWGIKYGERYAGATVPLLDDTLRWAAMFNLGVTWHGTASVEDNDSIDEQIEMLDKYGLTDNLLVITSAGNNLSAMSRFVDHNPRVSCFVGAESSWWTNANIAAVKQLQTEFNKIYVQLYPWSTVPTDSFLAMAKQNNFMLINSYVMSQSDLLDVDTFCHGYSYIEVQGVYAIKDTLRQWVNSLIDE